MPDQRELPPRLPRAFPRNAVHPRADGERVRLPPAPGLPRVGAGRVRAKRRYRGWRHQARFGKCPSLTRVSRRAPSKARFQNRQPAFGVGLAFVGERSRQYVGCARMYSALHRKRSDHAQSRSPANASLARHGRYDHAPQVRCSPKPDAFFCKRVFNVANIADPQFAKAGTRRRASSVDRCYQEILKFSPEMVTRSMIAARVCFMSPKLTDPFGDMTKNSGSLDASAICRRTQPSPFWREYLCAWSIAGLSQQMTTEPRSSRRPRTGI